MTVLMAFVPIGILALVGAIGMDVLKALPRSTPASTLSFAAIAIAWGLGSFLVLAGTTGVPSYFYHPKSVSILQQNRAIALSYYACGPLALMGIPAVVFVVGILLGFDHPVGGLAILIGATTPVGLLAAWWCDLIHLSRRLLPQRPGRAFGIAILVPILWCFVACVSLFAVPALVVLAIIISRSLA
jgi:hypothetical protein